ncbi:putative acetyltransferase [Rhizobium sp. PP-CC-3G-465]|nr:putative acetyltransferase [Rhizobium sp. PP-CC-3G-465]
MITAAFEGAPHSDGTEDAIVDALRAGGALTVSLIAERDDEIVGYVAFSRVEINGVVVDWYGLGPIAVRTDQQRQGIGIRPIQAGLDQIKALGAAGCVVFGDPRYYARFGFSADPALQFPDVPPEYFQRLDFGHDARHGVVVYHAAFYGA